MRTRCLTLRSATWVTEQELMTNAAAPGTALSVTRTPFAVRRRAMASESAWFSLQPRVRTETVGVWSRGITRHHRTANGERETRRLRRVDVARPLIPAAGVTADGAGGAALAVDEGAAAIRAARGAEELQAELCWDFSGSSHCITSGRLELLC